MARKRCTTANLWCKLPSVSFTPPRKINHHRWRHKIHGYTVTVLGVYSHGFPTCSQTVRVDRHGLHCMKPRSWDIHQFLEAFQPIGRPFKEKSLWDHLDD